MMRNRFDPLLLPTGLCLRPPAWLRPRHRAAPFHGTACASLASLLHTVLSLTDEHSRLVRAALPSRQTFFQDERALSRYLHFPSWAGLLRFMMRGLEIGPYAQGP